MAIRAGLVHSGGYEVETRGREVKYLLWFVLLVISWPLALLALVLYPIVWVMSLPFRVVGVSVSGAFALVESIIRLPARVLAGSPSRRIP
jgi:hypothetical protein